MSTTKHVNRLLLIGCSLVLVSLITSCGQQGAESTELATAAMCVEHGVPEAVCTRCNAELIPSFQASGDWCAEHSIPESQCVLCNPELAARGVVPVGGEAADPHAGHDHGPEGAKLESASLSNETYPGLSIIYRTNEPKCPTDEALINFASVETAERAGIRVEPVRTGLTHDHFEAPAEVIFDQNATVVLSSSLPLSVRRWLLEPGDAVAAGDALAEVESPDMALLQGDYLEAWSDWLVHDRGRQRAADMVARGLIDSASFERERADATGARARWVQSESRLRLAGLADQDFEGLRQTGEVRSRFELRATTEGVLLDRLAPLGRILEPGEDLARIGDPGALWIEGQVRERDATRLRKGQQVEFTADGGALSRTAGTVIWVASFLDPRSRTATVRVRPDDHTGQLRAHEFGRLHLASGPAELSILVPEDAVQWEGCCNVVFVQESASRYRPRKVEIAAGDAGHYRVTRGLSAEDRIVVEGSFLLKTELRKGAIGAGCCGLEAS